jgi:hypothetical protein
MAGKQRTGIPYHAMLITCDAVLVNYRGVVLGPHDPMQGPHGPMQSLIGLVHTYVGASSVQEKKKASSIKFPQLLTTNQPAIPT